MKSALLALAIAIPTALATMAPAADAKTRVSIGVFFGQPYYSYRVGPDYAYRSGFGWYHRKHKLRDKLSCVEARNLLRHRGFRILGTRDCSGTTYTFRTSRNGNRGLVYVNARTGAAWRS